VGDRSYQLYVPASVATAQADVPLLLVYPDALSSIFDAPVTAGFGGWVEHSEAHRFIVAFPNGYKGYKDPADLRFARQVVDSVRSKYCIDGSRIFPTGWSAGAIFAQYLACHASDLFASATGYAGWNENYTCLRPVSVGLFQGASDSQVTKQRALASADEWAEHNGCRERETQQLLDGYLRRDFACDRGVEVIYREYVAQDHTYPVGTRREDMLRRMWEFMNAHTLPATPPEVPSSVSLQVKRRVFSGHVTSPAFDPAVEAACEAGRKVNIQKVRPGPDRTVASVRTDEGGGYRVTGAKGAKGKFRALVTSGAPESHGLNVLCRSEQSPSVRLR
jgi:polyhydroxybutyrate depolymerase